MSTVTREMPVSELTGDEIITVTADSPLTEVARILADADIGAVVVGSATDVAGIVSERDIVRLVAAGGDPSTTVAGDLASTELVYCDADSPVSTVAEEMLETYVRHVLVTSPAGLIGIVSNRDLLGVYASDDVMADD